jgi:DNA polymerase elongation subunit (family B)
MVKVQFYPLDIAYREVDNKAWIYVFGKASDGKTICVIDDSFQPYFYIILKKDADTTKFREEVEKVTAEQRGTVFSVTGTEVVDKKYLGKDVKAVKVAVNLPKGVPKIKAELEKKRAVDLALEFDIPFIRRYLIDNDIIPLTLCEVDGEKTDQRIKTDYVLKSGKISQVSGDTVEKLRILAFDIETYNPLGKNVMPEKHPIVMISLVGDNFKKVITWKKFDTKHDYIEFVKSEADLIQRAKDVIDTYKPDILTGYFSDGFDLPYIKTRADKYKIKLDFGLDYSTPTFGRGTRMTARITGITHLDIFKFVRRVMAGTLETDSYKLDAVAEELLDEKKVDVEMEALAEAWDKGSKDIEKYCEYNLQDSNLTLKLCKKILPNIIELIKIVGLPIYDISRMAFSQLVEWYLIKQASHFKELAPNKPEHDQVKQRMRTTFKGGFVYEPKPGLYEDIAVFDFRSLYPTIISSHNIGLSTLNCKCCGKEENYAPVEGKKYWFCKEKKGFISKMITDLITRRMRVKEIMKEKEDKLLRAREYSLKILANAFYGYLGFYASRWYSIEAAQSVTAWGRHYIQKVIEEAKKNDFSVLYSDTDSIFIALKNKKRKDALQFAEKINLELPELMELEFEGFYPRGIFVGAKLSAAGAKKRYALISEKGIMKIKGFEAIRRNSAEIAKEVQEKVLKIILKDNDVPKALKYVKTTLEKIKNTDLPNKKMIIPTQITRDVESYEQIGPHVAAAKRMKARGDLVGPGTIVQYIVVQGKGMIRDRARLPDEIKEKDYDPVYYTNNQVIPAVEKIFEVLGYKKEDLLETKEQAKLEKFFGK